MNKEKIDISHISALAKLELTDNEAFKFKAEMQQFADFAACLEGFEPDTIDDSHRLSIETYLLREDIKSLDNTNVLSNAKTIHNGYVTVPVTVDTAIEREADK